MTQLKLNGNQQKITFVTRKKKKISNEKEEFRRSLQTMNKINKLGKQVLHHSIERQVENREVTCDILHQRQERKSFLHGIVTSNEKWTYFENPKWKKSWLSLGEACHSTPRPNRFGEKTILFVWWDQSCIAYYKLLKPGKTINAQDYRQQMINLNHTLIERLPELPSRHGKVIFLYQTMRRLTQKNQ